MDVSFRGNRAAAIANEPSAWERHILAQQGAFRRARPVRRFHVEGIPTYTEFKAKWEERHDPRNADRSQSGSEHDRPAVPERDAFNVNDLRNDLPSSKRSSQNSSFSGARSKHHPGSFRGSPYISPRFSPFNSPKRPRRYPTTDRHNQSFGSTESFEETVRRDKARFYTQQQTSNSQNSRSRPRSSALPKREQFGNIPAPKPRAKTTPSSGSATSLYHQWHDACDLVLQDKASMTAIPEPPISACGTCQNTAIMSNTETPVTCVHSLETLFRVGAVAASCSSHDNTTYFKILKEERNKWHTDRFGMCKPEHKTQIEQVAQTLFVAANELYVKEKARLELLAEREAIKRTFNAAPGAEREPDLFTSTDPFAGPEPGFW